MAVPPFPSQQLAKLVLGYLAEERLMTAYDEFLSASPYLDSTKNEYDRLFMTSLKSILAEYRAIKIFVETCKPVVLRRKLGECSGLLQVVQFLVQNVDLSKLNLNNTTVRTDSGSQTDWRAAACDVCEAPSNCDCMSRLSLQSSASHRAETRDLANSVQTTVLKDLPGNHVTTRRKYVKVLERESQISQSLSMMTCNSSSGENVEDLFNRNQAEAINCATLSAKSQSVHSALSNTTDRAAETMDSSRKMDEFNDILHKVCSNSTLSGFEKSTSMTTSDAHKERLNKMPYVHTFKDFATGVTASRNVATNPNVPDSSTSESYGGITPMFREKSTASGTIGKTLQEPTKTHILFKVGTIKNGQPIITYPGKVKPKPTEQKITILSDIKVDKPLSRDASPMPEVLRNATSTPMMRMQTILINGTPTYTQMQQNEPSQNFTKDEIMAMPTIIIVPNSSSSSTSTTTQAHTAVPSAKTIFPSAKSLEPLVIDVSNSPTMTKTIDSKVQLIHEQEADENVMLVKTMQGKNFSLPKDNIITTESTNKKTPQVVPPVRKSSSTPRRTSHVRVLDFATPRRILDDAIDEQGEHVENAAEVVLSRSPSIHKFMQPDIIDMHTSKHAEDTLRDSDESGKREPVHNEEKNNTSSNKKSNWDADLRAIAVANNDGFVKTVTNSKQRNKKQTNKRKSAVKKKTPKSKKRKPDEVQPDNVTQISELANVPVKPTINIVPGCDYKLQHEQNKSNEEPADTPELDKSSLQNVIGAKLNISELLETPYKQALYDIQMETPRFLGPDLPGEPLSDIKIMNIPTPRFLTSPKPGQATPSSYSSRPTDYSSGGSYYKPDDHDCLGLDDIGYPRKSAENSKHEEFSEADNKVSTRASSSRPTRKCAKNVSYYNHAPFVHKEKETNKDRVEDKADIPLSCSDSISCNSSADLEKQKETKVSKPKKYKKTNKPDKRERKRKSPTKKDTPKSFMKIKPRRPTPTKETIRKICRKPSESKPRMRTSSKEKPESTVPPISSGPTKSRRKSSTPRKLHCTKIFNSGDYSHESPDRSESQSDIQSLNKSALQESNQTKLKWTDDSPQDSDRCLSTTMNESEDITKIKEFIATSESVKPGQLERNLHDDLLKRGFDEETAKIIERDLLDAPSYPEASDVVKGNVESVETIADTVADGTKTDTPLEKTLESSTASAKLQIVQDDEDDEDSEVELSVHESNEDTANYIVCNHDETKEMPKFSPVQLKDNFCMEICIEDDITIKLKATPLTFLLDEDPKDAESLVEKMDYRYRETELAVSSISYIDKLYTPLKDSIKAQCYEIFDSTLTSLDTPLKVTSPQIIEHETTVTEIVLQVENVEVKDKETKKRRRRISSDEEIETVEVKETNKRKRCISSDEESKNEPKKTKPEEAPYLLNPANIQNIDIESVLCKLHGH